MYAVFLKNGEVQWRRNLFWLFMSLQPAPLYFCLDFAPDIKYCSVGKLDDELAVERFTRR